VIELQTQPKEPKLAEKPKFGQEAPLAQEKIETPEIKKNIPKIENLHQNPEIKLEPVSKKPDSKSEQKGFEKFSFGVNCAGVMVNCFTAFLQLFFKNNKIVSELLNKLANYSVSLSMGTNSAFNVYTSFEKKNLCQLLGYGGELAIAALAPYNYKGLLRGLSFTAYQIPQIVGSGGNSKFISFAENFNMLKTELPKAIISLFTKEGYSGHNVERSVGAWGALVSTLGVFGWMFGAGDKLAGYVKGFGELLIDIFQVLPKQWSLGKFNYAASGISFIVGSLCEIISKQVGNHPVLRDLYFAGSGIGRIFMTRSNTIGENNFDSLDQLERPSFGDFVDSLKNSVVSIFDKISSRKASPSLASMAA
jgi:hypothetical protein